MALIPTYPSVVMNGGHSPTALSGASATPNGVSSSGAPSSTAPLCTQHLPPTCSARQLCKLKRFLTTLQQFGRDISPEIGARVRSLVLGLVVSRAGDGRGGQQVGWGLAGGPWADPGNLLQNSSLTIEEFHSRLQEATNFPLRPFVIPFLKVSSKHSSLHPKLHIPISVPQFHIPTLHPISTAPAPPSRPDLSI